MKIYICTKQPYKVYDRKSMIYFATTQYCVALKYIGHDSQQRVVAEFDHVVVSQGITVYK